jgi:hypothetical protein
MPRHGYNWQEILRLWTKGGTQKVVVALHGACPTSIIGRNVRLGKSKLSTLSVPELEQRGKSKKDINAWRWRGKSDRMRRLAADGV